MSSSQTAITIIGFGAFGELVAKMLSPYARISVHDLSQQAMMAAAGQGYGVVQDPREICADIVILAVPLQALAQTVQRIAPHLRTGQLVVDVCSIKEEPARVMRQFLPPDVQILATHPMFGPHSVGQGGNQIVLCPVRGDRWRALARFLERALQLDVVVTTPEDHDRQAALTQGLTHLLARALDLMGEQPDIRTRSFDLMSEAFAMVSNDAPEVFEAITRGNRHVDPMRDRLLAAIHASG